MQHHSLLAKYWSKVKRCINSWVQQNYETYSYFFFCLVEDKSTSHACGQGSKTSGCTDSSDGKTCYCNTDNCNSESFANSNGGGGSTDGDSDSSAIRSFEVSWILAMVVLGMLNVLIWQWSTKNIRTTYSIITIVYSLCMLRWFFVNKTS